MKRGAKNLFAMMLMVVFLFASATIASAETKVSVWGDNTNKQLAYAPAVKLNGISVETAKNGTNTYKVGEVFNKKNLVVKAIYSDNSVKTVADSLYSVSITKALEKNDTKVTISYGGKSTKYSINVIYVKSIGVTGAKTEYFDGENFDLKNLLVKAIYSDKSEEVVTDYTIDITRPLRTSDKEVEISYINKTITKSVTTTYPITVKPLLLSISASGAKTVYTDKDLFDSKNLVVKAKYSDGNEIKVTDITINPARELTMADKFVTISFNGKSVEYPITVNHKLLSLTIAKATTNYFEGDKFDTSNLVINANYSDGAVEQVQGKDCKINLTGALKTSDKSVTISWGALSINCDITVKAIPKLTSITALNARTVYTEGESFDPTGMFLIAKYSDNSEQEVRTGWTVNPSGQLSIYNTYVTVSYQGLTTRYSIKVNEKTRLVGITVANAKTVYTEGEEFDTSTLLVKAKYSNNTEETVADYTVTPDRALTTSDRSVTVSYGGFSKNIGITVNAAKLSLTVINGSGSGAYGKNAKVLIAPTLKKGQYFAGWKMENGKILTYMETYYFLLTRSMTLEAVITDTKPTIEPVAALDETYTVKKYSGYWKLNILGTFTSNARNNFFRETGFLTVNEKFYKGGEITLNSENVVNVRATGYENAAGQVYRAIHTQDTGKFYVRAYYSYLDENYHYKTVYSDNTVLVEIK